MYPLGQRREWLLETLATQETHLSTAELAKIYYGDKYITCRDKGDLNQSLRTLIKRGFVERRKQEYQVKRSTLYRRRKHRWEPRWFWVWKITPKGLKHINGD